VEEKLSGRSHLVLTVLGMVAQMERRFIRERQRDGIDRAKAAGVYRGGKRRLDHDRIRAMRAEGVSVVTIAATLGCSRMQVYRVLAAG
jgi:DNA invertase Pin-like site-specific DNA recombinase